MKFIQKLEPFQDILLYLHFVRKYSLIVHFKYAYLFCII